MTKVQPEGISKGWQHHRIARVEGGKSLGNLHFLHFGTSVEVLSHLAKYIGNSRMQRTLALNIDDHLTQVATSAVIISSDISSMVNVGEQSLVYNCTFASDVWVGSKCIVLGIDVQEPVLLSVPDQHCLWEVPLLHSEFRVTLCCSIHDNPKVALSKLGTFCGKQWKDVFDELEVDESDVWPEKASPEEKNLWNAGLFPVVLPGKGIAFAMWLMGVHPDKKRLNDEWRRCKRMNLAELHGAIDFQKLCNERKIHQAKICIRLAEASVRSGFLLQDLYELGSEIVEGLNTGREACKDLLSLCLGSKSIVFKVPQSRVYQACVDLSNALEDSAAASTFEKNVWEAVASETAMAVGHNEETYCMRKQLYCAFRISRVKVELPARIDFAGGWSDTPPWSLEQTGTVLNMAVVLDRCAPIGVELEVIAEEGVCISDDAGHHTCIKDPTMLYPPYEHDDPFRLVKSALVVTGLVSSSALQCGGLFIKTWANVPRGSGLGTSSILAAAVVKAICQAVGADDSNEIITSLVLYLEQLMGTGGGWQDQVGGLYPGVKCTNGFPGNNLLLKVEPVLITPQVHSELEKRLVVFFTGQVRLAHNVLQNVVRRYLQRDSILMLTVKQLVYLAKSGREALRVGNLDELGKILLDVWLLHQELDPFCSNDYVDQIFKKVCAYSRGYKLVGAGGGGFGLLMANDEESAAHVKRVLQELSVKVYDWKISN